MKIVKCQRSAGFSLIELMVSLAIGSVILLAGGSLMTTLQAQASKDQRMLKVFEVTQNVQMALNNLNVCSANFYLTQLSATGSADIPSIYSYAKDPSIPAPVGPTNMIQGQSLLGTADSLAGISSVSMQLVSQGDLSKNLDGSVNRAAKLNINFSFANGGTETTSVPILAQVFPTNNTVAACTSTTGVVMDSVICQIGGQVYDPVSGSCNPPPQKWFKSGDPFTARCPAGQFPNPFLASANTNVCGCFKPVGFVDNTPSQSRSYTNNTSVTRSVPPYLASFNSATQTCSCVYAVDMPGTTDGWSAGIQCL